MNDLPMIWIVLAGVILTVIFVRLRQRRPTGGKRGLEVSLDDDLLRACRGDSAMAERLIEHELERKPKLSRTAATLLALSRLRDDKR